MWSERVERRLDSILDRFSLYRLVLYGLISLWIGAILLAAVGRLPFHSYDIIFSGGVLILVSWAANWLFARILRIPTNKDSELITALILTLIMTPASTLSAAGVLAVAAVLAIGSKYLVAISRRHIFNPAAFGAVGVALLFGEYPSWWVGTAWLVPLTAIVAVLVLRKVRRFAIFLAFLGVYAAALSFSTLLHPASISHELWIGLKDSGLIFFASIMLTEPLTSPAGRGRGMLYAAFTAVLYATPQLRLSGLALGPEMALLAGNGFSYLIAPNYRLVLRLIRKQKEAEGIYSFSFERSGLKFKAGQHLEWTLPHGKADSRGNRRFLTIASAPTEDRLMVAVRIPERMSSYKKRLAQMEISEMITAAHLAGSFTLPKDREVKIGWIAGGVGITPFRSMAKEMIDTGQRRPVRMLYAAKGREELAFTDLFDRARSVGLEPIYLEGQVGRAAIERAFPDYRERTFYVSGPLPLVRAVEDALLGLGVKRRRIKTDYFPGYA